MLCCRHQTPTDYELETLEQDISAMMNLYTSEYGIDGFPVFSTQVKMIGEYLIRTDYGLGYRGSSRPPEFIKGMQAFRFGVTTKAAYMGIDASRILMEFDRALVTINTCCFEYIYLKVVISRFKSMVDSVLQPFYLMRTGIRAYYTQS